jgi:flagellin-like hook-associated protein FlgL
MRVSWAYRFDAATAALERLQTQLLQHQQRLATGQRLQQLGDDPAALARVLRMDELIAQTQRQRDTLALLQQELQALQLHTEGLSDALAEIAVLLQEALDAKNLDKPALIAERLHQRLEDLVARANAEFAGHYLFAGTQHEAPFRLQRTTATAENPSGLQVTFAGNLQERTAQPTAGGSEALSIRADELFGQGGTELFGLVVAAYNLLAYRADGSQRPPEESLSAQEREQLQQLIPQLLAFRQRIDRVTARTAERQSRWQALAEQLEQYLTQLRAFRSADADTDLVQVALELQKGQTALQALLQTLSRVLTQSLFDML